MYRDELPPGSPPPRSNGGAPPSDNTIGAIIRRIKNLDAAQVENILAHQREHGLRFGEAAVALGAASHEDVVYALSQQFDYPYRNADGRAGHPELVVANRPFSAEAEAFRGIRSQLMMRVYDHQRPRRAIAVVSPDSGDGKSYFAANIAIAFSQLGGRTLLIDADMRQPRQHELFGLENPTGLSSVLSGRAESQLIHAVPDLPSLFVLPVGTVPPNPLELLERPGLSVLLGEVLQKFDHVIVDTPAFRHGMDGPVVAARCGAALIVARSGRSHMGAIQDLVATLSESPAEVAGVILNEF